MNKNIIINGNCIEELNKLPENSIDLIFADPPYWMRTEGTLLRVEGTQFKGCDDDWDKFDSLEKYEEFTYKWLNACKRVLKTNGSIWVIGSMQCIYTIGAIMQRLGFWIINDVTWHKKNPTPNFKGTRLNNSTETLIWATKSYKSKYCFNYKTAKELNLDTVSEDEYNSGIRKQMGSVWKFPVCSGNERLKDEDGNKLHNTQKPQELLERIILISSKKNDLILDPFGGTMTTAAASKKLGRNYIMIEKSKKYCEYGKKRLQNIEIIDNDFTNAKFDEKPLKVTLKEMIENNYLIEDEYFYLKSGEKIGPICKNGKIVYNDDIIDIHTAVALSKKVKAKKLNGFEHCYVKRDNKLVLLNDIREKYREFKSNT